jgi:UDP-glucose 4-epimerase
MRFLRLISQLRPNDTLRSRRGAEMTLLITGGTGFVLSNLARHWLEGDPGESVIVLDAAPWSTVVERFFAPVHDRLTFIQADVVDPATWASLATPSHVTHVVHGATMTLLEHESEKSRARQILEVNLMGTVNALDFARRLPALQRFIYVGSGWVYGAARPGMPDVPIREDGHTAPAEFYGITKVASEHITRHYGEVFGMDVASVRLGGVYGPMERVTPTRNLLNLPYHFAHMALAGKPVKVTALEAGGDWIHAKDVARAMAALLRAPRLRYGVYNVAYGKTKTVREMHEIVHEVVPDLCTVVVPEAEADIKVELRTCPRALDISRLREEIGWEPRPFRDALQSYVTWIRENE